MPDELAVEAAGLWKSYGGVLALAGVDLRVPAGSRCALLGPNGAGKPVTRLWHLAHLTANPQVRRLNRSA